MAVVADMLDNLEMQPQTADSLGTPLLLTDIKENAKVVSLLFLL